MTLNNALDSSHHYHIKRAILELDGPWALFHGQILDRVEIAYTLYGNPDLPCVLVLGGISSGRDLAHRTPDYASGWWQSQVGTNQSIDLRHYCVLGMDYLGGNGQSTPLPLDNDRVIPAIDTRDQARAINALADQLKIASFAGVIGSSYGAMVTLALCEEFPERVNKALAISGAHQTSVQSSAIRHIQRQIVLQSKANSLKQGLQLARALAMVTYRSPEELESRFEETPQWSSRDGFRCEITHYLNSRGKSFSEKFCADAFCCLSQSIDLHKIDPEKIKRPLTCVAIQQDQLIPLDLMDQFSQAANAKFISIQSRFGHDAFLKETETIGWIIKQFLNESTNNTIFRSSSTQNESTEKASPL